MISNETWAVYSENINQVWKIINDQRMIEYLISQLQFTFLNYNNISIIPINQLAIEYNKGITWEIGIERAFSISITLLINALEKSTLAHFFMKYSISEKNPLYLDYQKEIVEGNKKLVNFLHILLHEQITTFTNHESILINCNIKDLWEFIISWNFAEVQHSLISQVEFLPIPQGTDSLIKCLCKNNITHYYQITNIDNHPDNSIKNYQIKEINYYDTNSLSLNSKNNNDIKEGSHCVNFSLLDVEKNMSILSIEHLFNRNKLESMSHEHCLNNLIREKKRMLIEIKKRLEQLNINKIKNEKMIHSK